MFLYPFLLSLRFRTPRVHLGSGCPNILNDIFQGFHTAMDCMTFIILLLLNCTVSGGLRCGTDTTVRLNTQKYTSHKVDLYDLFKDTLNSLDQYLPT